MGRQYYTDRDFDWTLNLPRPDDYVRYATAVREIITVENYGVRWCATQFADRELLPHAAQTSAENVLTGWENQNRRENAHVAIAQHIRVKLEVLTRQACTHDASGAKLEDAEFGDKPLDGDIVRLNVGKRLGIGGEPLSQQDHVTLRQRGLTDAITQDFMIIDGCIEVPYSLAVGLLADYGFRCSKPEHYSVGPSKKAMSEAQVTGKLPRTRVIANWLYREAFDTPAGEPTQQERKSARR